MTRTLLAFDIDGTLIDTRSSFNAAVKILSGVVDDEALELFRSTGGFNDDWGVETHKRRNRRPGLNAFLIPRRRKRTRIRFTRRRRFSGRVFIAVQVVDAHAVKQFEKTLAHGGVTQAFQSRRIADERNHSELGVFNDLSLGHAEKANYGSLRP